MHSTSGLSLVISGNSAQRISAEHVLEGYCTGRRQVCLLTAENSKLQWIIFNSICNIWHTNTGDGWKTWYVGN